MPGKYEIPSFTWLNPSASGVVLWPSSVPEPCQNWKPARGFPMKFTVNTVTNTKPELPLNQTTGEQKTDHISFDERLKGFGLRVRAGTNIKVWLYQYSLHNRTQRVKIGEWPAMQPAEAYDRARVLHAERHAGVDPAHVKRQRQEAKE